MTGCDTFVPAKLYVRALKLVWRLEPRTERLVVGTLSRHDGVVSFSYDGPDLDRAKALGFRGYGGIVDAFELSGDQALAMFRARLPSPSRPDYAELLAPFGVSVTETDPIILLAATSGPLPTDQYEFLPLLEPVRGTCLYSQLAGLRYHAAEECLRPMPPGTKLSLVREPENQFDRDAVRVELNGQQVGYLKKVISTSIAEAFAAGLSIEACLTSLRENGVLNEAIVRLRYE